MILKREPLHYIKQRRAFSRSLLSSRVVVCYIWGHNAFSWATNRTTILRDGTFILLLPLRSGLSRWDVWSIQVLIVLSQNVTYSIHLIAMQRVVMLFAFQPINLIFACSRRTLLLLPGSCNLHADNYFLYFFLWLFFILRSLRLHMAKHFLVLLCDLNVLLHLNSILFDKTFELRIAIFPLILDLPSRFLFSKRAHFS